MVDIMGDIMVDIIVDIMLHLIQILFLNLRPKSRKLISLMRQKNIIQFLNIMLSIFLVKESIDILKLLSKLKKKISNE